MERCVYVVSGIPGAGKTTIARLLARRFECGVHIESDQLQRFVVTGGYWPDGQPSFAADADLPWGTVEEGERQFRLRGRNACLLAASFLEGGFTPVVDDVIVGGRLQHFRDDLRGQPMRFVLLTPNIDVVRERDATRAEKHVFHKWAYLDEVMRNETPHVGLRLDTSNMTVEESVNEILRCAEEARID